MKILPKRWWIVAGGAAFGAFAVLTWFARSREFEVTPLVIGVVVGALIGLAIVASYAGRDTALAELREQYPDAIVVAVRRDDATVSVLSALSETVGPVSVGGYVMVAFLPDGIGWWRGRPAQGRLAFVPWADVESIELGADYIGKTRSDPSFARLRLVLRDRDGLLPSIQVGVLTDDALGIKYRSQDGLLELLDRIRVLRGGIESPRKPVSYVSSGLIPGVTAFAASRIGRLPIAALPWIVQPIFLAGVLLAFLADRPAVGYPLMASALAGAALFLGLFFRELRAAQREAAAGYTTLNSGRLQLEQRHPVTGAVIRHAGERALTKEEFADRLR